MQLLHASSVPIPQFASISLLLTEGLADPLITVASNSSCLFDGATASIRELHCYILSIIQSQETNDVASELLREEGQSLNSVQIYRPLTANGLGLHFQLIRTSNETTKLQSLILANNKSSPGKIDPASGVIGVVLSVAVSGMGMFHCHGSIPYSLSERITDCKGHLQRVPDVASAKALLTTFLLTEHDISITNDRIDAPNVLLLPESGDRSRGGGVLSPMGMISPIAEFGRTARRASTGIVRGVISVGTGLGGGAMNTGSTQDAPPPVELGFPVRLDHTSAEATRTMSEKLTVLSVAESGTLLRKYNNTGRDRMANLDLTSGAKSRFRRRKLDSRAADFDSFDYKGPARVSVKRENKTVSTPQSAPEAGQGKLQLKSSSKDTRRGGGAVSRRMSTVATSQNGHREDDSSHRLSQLPKNTNSEHASHRRRTKAQSDDETNDSRSHSGNNDGSSVMSQDRVQVNIALNEDLTCSYKLSQLSSCNVEGVIQAQIKSTMRTSSIPFSLLVRDASSQLATLHENKKFAEKVLASLNGNEGEADYRFKVNLPKQETYFPLLKYKCSADLRPVPIRVQTKVKSDAGFCRVALQISSNPNNDASLSDLTIVMGVPNTVRGETLATQPAGGVWDRAKSTVVWCVSELGSGEKFQLQARFEVDTNAPPTSDMSFPVLVRCQCLHVQLSDIEFEVGRSSNDFPVEMIMKVARRFRLSHREKNG